MKTLPFLNGSMMANEYTSRLKAVKFVDELVKMEVIESSGGIEDKPPQQATISSGKSPSKIKDQASDAMSSTKMDKVGIVYNFPKSVIPPVKFLKDPISSCLLLEKTFT